MKQRSLFPDGFEVQEHACAALRELDVGGALVLVRRARQIDSRLVDVDGLEEALAWLAPRIENGRTGAELADALRAVVSDALAGRIGAVAAMFVDTAIARFLRRRLPPDSIFIDQGCRVPVALLDMILGNSGDARASLLDALQDGNGDRADLWGCLGDACFADQRHDEAIAAYVRSLLLDPVELDAWRLRDRRLAECLRGLQVREGDVARHLLIVEGWMTGILDIPMRNNWLTHRQLARLLEVTAASTSHAKAHRFGLLLYLDRSAGLDAIDVARREEMAELRPADFERFMATCREREGRSSGGRPAP